MIEVKDAAGAVGSGEIGLVISVGIEVRINVVANGLRLIVGNPAIGGVIPDLFWSYRHERRADEGKLTTIWRWTARGTGLGVVACEDTVGNGLCGIVDEAIGTLEDSAIGGIDQDVVGVADSLCGNDHGPGWTQVAESAGKVNEFGDHRLIGAQLGEVLPCAAASSGDFIGDEFFLA